MIRALWKKLQATLEKASTTNGRSKSLSPVEVLQTGYRELRRLAAQIQTHAERAPYPQVAQRLRQIALEKRNAAMTLNEKIPSAGRLAEESDAELKSGKNHWERMGRDLEDQKTLDSFFEEQAARLAEQAPDISRLLEEILAGQTSHREAFLDLIARADPQAYQS